MSTRATKQAGGVWGKQPASNASSELSTLRSSAGSAAAPEVEAVQGGETGQKLAQPPVPHSAVLQAQRPQLQGQQQQGKQRG